MGCRTWDARFWGAMCRFGGCMVLAWGFHLQVLGCQVQILGCQVPSFEVHVQIFGCKVLFWASSCNVLGFQMPHFGVPDVRFWGFSCQLLGCQVQCFGVPNARLWGSSCQLLGCQVLGNGVPGADFGVSGFGDPVARFWGSYCSVLCYQMPDFGVLDVRLWGARFWGCFWEPSARFWAARFLGSRCNVLGCQVLIWGFCECLTSFYFRSVYFYLLHLSQWKFTFFSFNPRISLKAQSSSPAPPSLLKQALSVLAADASAQEKVNHGFFLLCIQAGFVLCDLNWFLYPLNHKPEER